jgi:NADPH:quinone reductase-like Zn-dependent oxidoreductase
VLQRTVNLIPSFSMNEYFTYGEVIIAPDYAVVKHPKSLSFAEAASIWMMLVTPYGALIEDAKVTRGDFVIISAASSSVGLGAIQMTNYAGATSIALTRTSAKAKQLLDAGAAHVIATKEIDMVQEVMRITAVEFILKGIEVGALKPVIDRAFKFEDMVEVHRYLEKNGQFGKIVVTV